MEIYSRAVAEINLNAITHNIQEIKRITGEESKLMTVVKADAYGHGVLGIVETLQENSIDYLAVAIIEEGIQLRRKDITLPILILGAASEDQAEELVRYDLTQTVFTYSMAEAISKAGMKFNKQGKIHIKVDTGMGRIGFFNDIEGMKTIEKIMRLPNIKIEGIYTHFAKADETDKTFTNIQLERFNKFLNLIKKGNIQIPLIHASNSAGIVDVPNAKYNLVRAGIILYGLYPSKEVNRENIQLKPVMQFKSRVVFVKEVDAETPISYGGTYITPGKRRIATIPVGYADGYSRLLSSVGRVLIDGKYAPIVGRICMDQFMVDVTNIENAVIGSEVVLIGEQKGKSISADEIAEHMGTINYEVVCMVNKRIPRSYIKNDKVVSTINYLP